MLIILTEETITLTEVHFDALPLKTAKRAEKKSHLIQNLLKSDSLVAVSSCTCLYSAYLEVRVL